MGDPGRHRVPLADGTLVATPDLPPEDLIPSFLAASDVLGTGWFGAVAAEAGPGTTVAVVGDGAVGLLAVLAAKHLGAERIIAMSRHQPDRSSRSSSARPTSSRSEGTRAGNRDNPPETWIWSESSAHPAIVSKKEFGAVAARAAANRGSRQGATPTRHQYLYRGILRCGICGLRMWGNHRRASVYYSCQPSHQRSANIPADHPAHVYLGEPALHEAVVGFLSTALFGPERQTYWRRRLADSEVKQSAAPAAERLKEVTSEVTDLQRRIERQIANLEAEDTTPALRRRIAARILELEEAVEDRRQRAAALAQEVADAPPTAADLATALDQLPLLKRLPELPQPQLRALFDSLRLQVAFHPAEAAVDVEVALFADEPPDRRPEVAEVQSVPPGGVRPDLRRFFRLRQRLRLGLKRSS